MKEETIISVANILENWNPLGETSNSIPDLEGYRYEAIDILSTINFMSGPDKIEKAIEQVLSQAFKIKIDKQELPRIALNIKNLLDN